MIVLWKRWLAPSLTRRLVVAQMVLAAILWIAALAAIGISIEQEDEQLSIGLARRGADAVFSVVAATRDQPARMADALQKLDAYQRAFVGVTEDAPMRVLPKLLVWNRGAIVYRSADAPADLNIAATDTLVPVQVAGRPMRAYARESADAQTKLLVLLPSMAESSGLTFWSRGVLLLPLLISLPLLIVPAWLSVRLALRPWRKLSDEITVRNADDLSALNFVARHRELVPLAQAIDGLLVRVHTGVARERGFIADAAHELRTPLAATRINAEALRAHIDGPSQRELLDNLMRSTRRGTRLVSQLLALTRAESAAPREPMSVVALDRFIQQRLAELAPLAAQREIELVFDAGDSVEIAGHAEALASIVDNLVDNAIKYSPQRGVVCISLRRRGADVELVVTDQGPGIAPEWRERVFERFVRVPDQQQPGSGLGLAIVKSAAGLHHGAVSAGPGVAGSGLCVTVRLPV